MDDEALRDVFAGLGPVTIKKMFGGKGIWHQGIMVGAVVDGVVRLRGDAISGPEFEAAGGTRWTYSAKMKKAVNMPYWTIPDSAIDDPDELAIWTRKAYESALRAKKK